MLAHRPWAIAWFLALGVAVTIVAANLKPARACSLCANLGKSLAESVADADVVLFGTLSGAALNDRPNPGESNGTTELEIQRVIKGHLAIAGKTSLTLPRFLPDARDGRVECIVFAEMVNGQVDPYRAMTVETNRFVDYLADVVRLSAGPAREKFAYLFDRLDDEDPNVSGDVYKEFANAPNVDIAMAASTFDPARLRSWIEDPRTPTHKIGLYACLLGMHGRKGDAEFLRGLVRQPLPMPPQVMDGVLAGLCLLDPKHGPRLALAMLCDPANDFTLRYAALRALRFLFTDMPQLDKAMLLSGMLPAIALADMSDLIIDDLRKHQFWRATDRIIGLDGRREFGSIVIRRSIVRFALQSPAPAAENFLARLRAREPRLVEDAEAQLRFESEPAHPGAPTRSTSGVGAGS